MSKGQRLARVEFLQAIPTPGAEYLKFPTNDTVLMSESAPGNPPSTRTSYELYFKDGFVSIRHPKGNWEHLVPVAANVKSMTPSRLQEVQKASA